MIVSEDMARRHWRSESALGARVRWSERLWTVVGIVGDVKHVGLDSEVESTFYVPHAQTGYGEMTLVVSTAGDPARVMPLLREAVWSVDPDLPVTVAGTMDSLVRESAANDRYRTLLLAVFSAIAAVLAAVGVFGTTARIVAQRNQEMGIRIALGARAGDIAKMILRWSFSTGIMGTLLGLPAAFWTSRLLARFLFGVESRDPLTYAAVASLLLTICLAASAVPARRATKVDPVQVLRAE